MVPLVGNILTICTNLITNGTIGIEIGANGKNGNAIGTNGTNVTNPTVPFGELRTYALLADMSVLLTGDIQAMARNWCDQNKSTALKHNGKQFNLKRKQNNKYTVVFLCHIRVCDHSSLNGLLKIARQPKGTALC